MSYYPFIEAQQIMEKFLKDNPDYRLTNIKRQFGGNLAVRLTKEPVYFEQIINVDVLPPKEAAAWIDFFLKTGKEEIEKMLSEKEG